MKAKQHVRLDSECMFNHSFEAAQHTKVGFGLCLSIVLKLNSMLGLDSECMINHHVEAKQHAAVGVTLQV